MLKYPHSTRIMQHASCSTNSLPKHARSEDPLPAHQSQHTHPYPRSHQQCPLSPSHAPLTTSSLPPSQPSQPSQQHYTPSTSPPNHHPPLPSHQPQHAHRSSHHRKDTLPTKPKAARTEPEMGRESDWGLRRRRASMLYRGISFIGNGGRCGFRARGVVWLVLTPRFLLFLGFDIGLHNVMGDTTSPLHQEAQEVLHKDSIDTPTCLLTLHFPH